MYVFKYDYAINKESKNTLFGIHEQGFAFLRSFGIRQDYDDYVLIGDIL